MKLTAAQIRYLLAIHQLSKNGGVRSSDVADHLGVSRPSAHRMVDQLLKMGFITKERYSLVRLTEGTSEMTGQYQNGFLYISQFLHEYLDLSPDTAADGALSILSGLSVGRLKELCIRLDEPYPHQKIGKAGL